MNAARRMKLTPGGALWHSYLILAGTGLFLVLFIILAGMPRLVSITADDAGYYFEIAENVAEGRGTTFDGMHRTNGFQPLWLLVLAGLCRITDFTPESACRSGLLLETALLLLGGWLLLRLQEAGSRATLVLSSVIYCFMVFIPAVNGMESGLLVMTIAVSALYGFRLFQSSDRRLIEDFGWGGLMALIVLSRLDLVFLPMVVYFLYIIEVLRGRAKTSGLVVSAAGFCAIFLPYLLYNLIQFGHPVPLSGRLKSSFPAVSFTVKKLLSIKVRYLISAASAVVYLWWHLKADKRGYSRHRLYFRGLVAVLAATNIVHFTHTLLFMKWAVMPWHFITYDLFLALASGEVSHLVLEELRAPLPRWLFNAGIILLLAAGTLIVYHRSTRDLNRSWHVASYRAALWARENTPKNEVFAMKDAGLFGFFSSRKVINLDGLVNDLEYQEVLKNGRLLDYLERNEVRFLAQHAVWNEPSVISGKYKTLKWKYFSYLYDTWSGDLMLKKQNEIYRSEMYYDGPHRSVFLIWKMDFDRAF